MSSKAAEILAFALEQAAEAYEADDSTDLKAPLEAARHAVRPINDIPRPIYKLAIRFWEEWVKTQHQPWRYQDLLSAGDWPVMARTIAEHVRQGTMPRDRQIIDIFVRRRSVLSWRDLKQLMK